MKTQHILIAVSVVVAVLLLVSLRQRPRQTPVVVRPAPTTVPQSSPLANRQGSSLRQTDAGGSTWSLDLAGGQSFPAMESNGAKPGAPIIVKTDVQRSGQREVSVGLLLEGQAGEQYRPVVKKDGTPLAAPALRIVNEAGQVVAQDTFKYG
jgi:hypothetical protein